MRFPLRRFYQDERQTLGTLTVGATTLFTIEPPPRNNQPNLSCIPEGRYRMTIVDVDGEKRIRLDGAMIRGERTLINIEVANFASELGGCIGVGEGVQAQSLSNHLFMTTDSQAAWDRLLAKLAQLEVTDVVCTLQISDPWE